MSEKAKKRYINSSTNKINENILKNDAEHLPQRFRNWKNFKESFGDVNHYNYDFYQLFRENPFLQVGDESETIAYCNTNRFTSKY